ncbi:MAG: glycosyltransferase, partial [Acholeplasmatales bacterium]|nr:glycosyltransferase [Acholeplasmatales bacterium]
MLDIIIPQYMEDEHTIKNLLDSIMNQKNIDFNDIQVTIINDASTCILSNEFLMNYEKLNIIYLRNDKNLGPGLTRQRGIDSTDEPFIMFMDADDEYINSNVLSRILDYLKKYNPNYLV